MNSVKFEPVYGWGWFMEPGTTALAVPAPFSVDTRSISAAEIAGLIEPPHAWAGLGVRLGLRGETGGRKHWNVRVSKPGQGQIAGFAESA
jgi:hypothetical protein